MAMAKTWMAGTSPAMTEVARRYVPINVVPGRAEMANPESRNWHRAYIWIDK
jgi:hypothetical protein